MSKKTFSERLNEIVKAAKANSKDGSVKTSFSRKFYDDVACAVLNDPDYEFEEVRVRNGKPTVLTIKPSKAFREKIIAPILSTMNVDNDDVKRFVDDYQFSQAQAATIYDISSAINWEYMNTGKILRLPSKPDFVGSINVRNIDESVYENKKTGVKTKRKAHKALLKRSTTPSWCKEKM